MRRIAAFKIKYYMFRIWLDKAWHNTEKIMSNHFLKLNIKFEERGVNVKT